VGTSTRTVAVTPRQPQHDSLSLGLSDSLEDWSLDDSSSDWLSETDDSDDEDSDGLDELSEGLDEELSEGLSEELLLSERLDESLQLLELLDSSISQQLPSRTMAQQTPLFFCFHRICADPSMHVCR
jgi:hypothetical protein